MSCIATVASCRPAQAQYTDPVTVQFAQPGYTVNESAGSVTITATLSQAAAELVSVNYATANGTAIAPDDYTTTSGTLTFQPGETSKTFTVAIVNNTITEPEETFNLTLSNSQGATLGLPSTAMLTILDDDAPPVVQFSESYYGVLENAGTATITVNLVGSTSQTVTVCYMTSGGTATSPSDYTLTSGTLAFQPGETSKTFTVTIGSDTTAESDETVNLMLSLPMGATLGSPSSATLTIRDNDDSLPPQLSIVAAGNFIVPGSQLNAVRYAWTPSAVTFDSVTMQVRDKNGAVVRTMTGLPASLPANAPYAEHRWDGYASEGMAGPLTESLSPYTIQITATLIEDEISSSPVTAQVHQWKLAVRIDDTAIASETLVSGVDPDSVNPDTLDIIVALDDASPGSPVPYTVIPKIEAPGGPAGNERSCRVKLVYTFYTTPTAPYDIRYTVIMQQKTCVVPEDAPRELGVQLITVIDGVGNPWDMDPTQPGRQTRYTWRFGVDTAPGNMTTTHRGPVEVFE